MRKVIVCDDLDNDIPADEAMPFVFDGEAYVIDLCAENAQQFRDDMEKYRAKATRLGKHKIAMEKRAATAPRVAPDPALSARARATRNAGSSAAGQTTLTFSEWHRTKPGESTAVTVKKKEYRARVREWAREQSDYEVGERGLIPTEVYEAYERWCVKNKVPYGPESVGL